MTEIPMIEPTPASLEVSRLADWLIANTDEPRGDYGIVDAAINVMERLKAASDDWSVIAGISSSGWTVEQ